MSKVTPLFPKVNGPVAGLRAIADQIESGQIFGDRVTLVAHGEVFHLGTEDDSAALHASVFDLQAGLHRLMINAFGVVTE